MTTYLEIILLFWQLGLVDTFNQSWIKIGSWYEKILVTMAARTFFTISLKVLLESFTGRGTSYQFIKADQITAKGIKQILTFPSFRSTSSGFAITIDSILNPMVCSSVGSKIEN